MENLPPPSTFDSPATFTPVAASVPDAKPATFTPLLGSDPGGTDIQRQIAELDRRVQSLVQLESEAAPAIAEVPQPPATKIWGVPFARLTLETTLTHLQRLIAAGRPGFFITANLNYVMLSDQQSELREVNERASFIVADGMPILWRSRLSKAPLPERVAGSELIYAIGHLASVRGYRLFLLGAATGVAERAAARLQQRYPGLEIAGVECPPFRPLDEREQAALIARIRAARADILFVALGQPKGELWLAENIERLGVPVCVQLGASFDFVAGQVSRAPRWLQRFGLEWLHRACQDPRRLAPRYGSNLRFLARMLAADLRDLILRTWNRRKGP